METRKVMKGNHSRKTAAFVRVCSKEDFELQWAVQFADCKSVFPVTDKCVTIR
jgi:hypothetical protein